ncbi:hypothetical protein MASR2M117_07940 [Paludibacter sp.]
MKRISTFMILSALSILSWQVSATTPANVLTGASLPTEQGWSFLKLDATVNDVAAPTTVNANGGSGVVKFSSTNAVDQFSQLLWKRTDLELDLNTGYTIVLKTRVIKADKTAAFNIQGFDKNGKGFRVGILKDAVTELTNPFAATNLLAGGLVNDDEFHTYRLTGNPETGLIEVYRDEVEIGSFPATKFQFDNIIENGGFEDPEFPDFKSNGIMTRISKEDDHRKVRNGNYSLEMYNNGLVTDGWTNIEGAGTRQIAVKPETDYELFITRRRTSSEPWCWRDMGAFYDFQAGTLNGVDQRGQNVTWGGFDRMWQIHPQNFKTPANAKTVRLEFPTWKRDGTKDQNKTSFDNVTLRERLGINVGPAANPAHGFNPVPSHDGYVNLIQNGGFEDFGINNDGTAYTWTLSNADNSNEPVGNNPLWNGSVRIQRNDKPDDQLGGQWAHSGTSSLRFSTLGNKANNFDFTKELEANKTYRFNFWHRNPHWNDYGWISIKIGENVIWRHELGGRNNVWANCDLIFTTSDENKTLHLYTISDDHGGWMNIFFDDFVLYEIPGGTPIDPQIAGKTNLIANGDFEDATLGNDGQPYTWALASTNPENDHNYPVAYSNVWGSFVRLQDKQKHIDTGKNWAHSGTKSLRFSYLDDWDKAQQFEGITGAVQPDAYKTNMDFTKELEPNKTYTFVFWVKAANYNDKGRFVVGNGDIRLWDEELSTKYINWTRKSITFSTTTANHTLKMFTEFGGWFNFYLDDLFLYEEEVHSPAPVSDGISYLAFGKSTGTSSSEVEIEYIYLDNTGNFDPNEFFTSVKENNDTQRNAFVNAQAGILTVNVVTPSEVTIYNVVGAKVQSFNVSDSKSIQLSAGTYLVKVRSEIGNTETIKVINR